MSAAAQRFADPFLREYFLDGAYDEMFTPDGTVRRQYRLLLETYRSLPTEEILRRKHSADMSFPTQGITFTVTEKRRARNGSSPTTCCRASSPARSGAP